MINAFRQSFHINASMGCNRLLYWLGRLPLVGRRLPAGLYADISLKQGLVLAVELLSTLWAFLGKFIYLGLCCVLPFVLVLGGETGTLWQFGVHALFWLSFAGGCFMDTNLLDATLLKYTCVRQMGMNARDYLLSRLAWVHLLSFASFTPALMVFTGLFGPSPWAGLLLSVELAALRLAAEGVLLLVYVRSGKVLCKSFWYILVLILAALGGAYLPLALDAVLPVWAVLGHPATALALLALGICSLAGILRYPSCRALVNDTCKADMVSVAAAKQKAAQAAFRDVELRDSDWTAGVGDPRLERLHGYAYLNAIFFRRHRRLLVRPVKIELAIVAGALAAGLAACLFARPLMGSAMTGIGAFLPPFVFLMYLAGNSLGQRICKAMFYNCDISLLRYGWYRQPSVVLRNFWVRLRRVAAMNLLVAGAVCLCVLILTGASGARPAAGDLIPFLLCILCLAVLFAVHPLFMYYIFQPYTTQLAVKNPFFGIINWVMYLVCYLCIQIDQPPQGFALMVLAATLTYIAAALLLVRRKAPKTFRVK